jgi:hypothetical protein
VTAAPATCTARGPSEVGKRRRRSRGSHRRAHWGGGETARQSSAVSSGGRRRPHEAVALRWPVCGGKECVGFGAVRASSWRSRLGPGTDDGGKPARLGGRRSNGAGSGQGAATTC